MTESKQESNIKLDFAGGGTNLLGSFLLLYPMSKGFFCFNTWISDLGVVYFWLCCVQMTRGNIDCVSLGVFLPHIFIQESVEYPFLFYSGL